MRRLLFSPLLLVYWMLAVPAVVPATPPEPLGGRRAQEFPAEE